MKYLLFIVGITLNAKKVDSETFKKDVQRNDLGKYKDTIVDRPTSATDTLAVNIKDLEGHNIAVGLYTHPFYGSAKPSDILTCNAICDEAAHGKNFVEKDATSSSTCKYFKWKCQVVSATK